MGIKSEADSIFFSKHLEQRELANRLSEAFDVTFGDRHGDLSFWLAQPTQRAQQRFGLQKEVLVIYSKFPVTDARVLTAIENISRSPNFKHRIDRVLTLLIHSGDPQNTSDLVMSDTERVIVPIAATELTHPERGNTFVRARLTEVLGAVDLFGMSSPLVSDKFFFGRGELVQQLTRRAMSQHQNSGLFGLRKTGKTSVLFAVGRAFENLPILFEYFDCQNPGIHNARWWDALANIAGRLRDTLSRSFNRKAVISASYSKANAGTQFSSDIQTILDVGQVDQVVVALDEIEYITAGLSGRLGAHWDEDFVPFWQTIRATHQELRGKLSFIVAGVNPTCVQQSHFGSVQNPIFQLAQPYYLEPLDAAATKTMVRTIGRYAGLSFSEPTFVWLQRKYGGHPYLIRLATSEVWAVERPINPDGAILITSANYEALQDRIKSRLSQPIKDILLSLVWWYQDEYSLLQILADGDTEFVRDYLRQNPDSVLQFARYGILREKTGEFAIEDIRDFLREHGETYKREISPFQRSDMPPEVLPEIPDLQLLGQLFEKRCEVEIRLRRVILMYMGVRFSWAAEKIAKAISKGLSKRPDRPNPEALFVGRAAKDVMHELFVPDMKEIISQNWDVFCNLFDNNKTRFEMNMDTINRARRVDSHTKPINKSEADEFENSYQWLLGRLRQVEGGFEM